MEQNPHRQPDRWTSLNIGLHWLILALIVVQWTDAEWMPRLFDAWNESRAVTQGTLIGGWLHMLTGAAVFLAVALRLWDRWTHGRPAHPEDEPHWTALLARVTHFALYAVLLAMPLLGLGAVLLGSEALAGVHTTLWTLLLVLVGLHLLGVAANRWWFHSRTDVLARMMPGNGRRM